MLNVEHFVFILFLPRRMTIFFIILNVGTYGMIDGMLVEHACLTPVDVFTFLLAVLEGHIHAILPHDLLALLDLVGATHISWDSGADLLGHLPGNLSAGLMRHVLALLLGHLHTHLPGHILTLFFRHTHT